MPRGLVGVVSGLLMLCAPLAQVGTATPSAEPSALARFLALDDPNPTQFRALRHLEASNSRFEKSARMDVWTEGDASGLRYTIVAEEGSEYIRTRVFRASLEAERAMWASGAPDRAALTRANYLFEELGVQPDGLTSLGVKPLRRDLLLVDGVLYLDPADGDLVRMEGRLSKTPSFWTRQVKIVRWFKRFAGVRMPVALESVALVRIAGSSTFRMTYEYESVNNQRIGSPRVVVGQ